MKKVFLTVILVLAMAGTAYGGPTFGAPIQTDISGNTATATTLNEL